MKQHTRQTQQLLGLPIDVISFEDAKNRVLEWAHARQSRYVVFANVHVLVTATQEPKFGSILTKADMVAPDGAPLAWMIRQLSSPRQRRVCGPDMAWSLLGCCEQESLPVYFYGSSPQTLALLKARLASSFPALQVAGFESPPFRPSTVQEDMETVHRINASGAGLLFVGLGCPKQEQWMHAHRGSIHAVMLGVGAAFDFHAGTVDRAPVWMQKSGLEWLHRLYSEPTRLWKRYLMTNAVFVTRALVQLLSKQKNK
jgi:N-acetylglucosaminyldiphosphoundecaprenol N-acetyl-beta-D-mannosaminyltransferase